MKEPKTALKGSSSSKETIYEPLLVSHQNSHGGKDQNASVINRMLRIKPSQDSLVIYKQKLKRSSKTEKHGFHRIYNLNQLVRLFANIDR